MKVINLKKCPSTQAYLTNFISKFPEFISGPMLVMTQDQPSGFGRRGNDWEFYSGSLAMSFILKKLTYEHLTPLAVGLSCVNLFNTKNITLRLKWPNDLMNKESQKIGGIICQQVDDYIVCGVGINFNQTDISWGSIKVDERPQKIAEDLYEYILSNTLEPKDVIEQWVASCCHINQEVEVIDSAHKTFGKFVGIDKNGSALIDNTLEIKAISSGSLFFR